MPSLAASNGLHLDEIPHQLKDLNPLETVFVSRRVPFMKVVALPSGQQKAVHGTVVNVLIEPEESVSTLPRVPSSESIVLVKLKRKLAYRGHVLVQNIHPQKIKDALYTLKYVIQNPLYEDVIFNEVWEQNCSQHDPVLWCALTNNTAGQTLSDLDAPTIAGTPANAGTECSEGDGNQSHASLQHEAGGVTQGSDGENYKSLQHEVENLTVSSEAEPSTNLRHEAEDVTAASTSLDLRIEDGAGSFEAQASANVQREDENVNGTSNDETSTSFQHEAEDVKGHSDAEVPASSQHDPGEVLAGSDVEAVTGDSDAEGDDNVHEENERTRLCGLPFDSCLLPKDVTADSNLILNIAPGEGKRPLGIEADEHGEELSFPHLFPSGKYGFSMKRLHKLSMKK